MVEAYETAIHGEVTGAPPPGDVDAPVETSEQTIVESADPATPADTMPDAAPAAPWQQPAPRKFLPQAPTRSIPRRAWIIVWAWIIGGIAVLLMLGILVARQILNLGIPAPTVEVTEEATGTPDAATGPPSAPAPTLTAGEQEKQVAEAGVTRNDDWTPYIEEFNGVPMALIPAGCFQMGSTSGDLDEQPVHEVCFEEPFWIDVYEITNEQHGGENPECTAVSSGSSQPLICTNWIIAQAYCNNRDARLPTEAEWEYAARGPDGPVFPWGNTFVGNHAIFSRNSELRAWDVGSRPNGVSWVGAFDLSGNVTEWVSDWYGEYERGTQVNPQGASNSEYRVLRGGAWNSEPYALRSTDRSWSLPFDDHGTVGFRCAQDY
jgi:formylglycine-generating enzyme required for sulfatase activity